MGLFCVFVIEIKQFYYSTFLPNAKIYQSHRSLEGSKIRLNMLLRSIVNKDCLILFKNEKIVATQISLIFKMGVRK